MSLEAAATALATATRVVVFTGAGVSAESGVPTFRDDLTGLWARFDAEELATPGTFRRDPESVWGWYERRRARVSADGLVRPGVVWFGESLPDGALAAAAQAAAACDLLLTVGTSGVVYPAAEIPHLAAQRGATVVQVNPAETPLDRVATVNLRGAAGAVLPQLVAAAWP